MTELDPDNPAVQAMTDQARASADEAAARLVSASRASGLSGDVAAIDATQGPAREFCARLAERALSGQLQPCPHLPIDGGPRPTYWLVCRPGKLRCLACLSAAGRAVKGTRQDMTCDHCGRYRPGSTRSGYMLLPAGVGEIAGQLTASGGVTVLWKLCPPCFADYVAHTDVPPDDPGVA